VLSAVALFGEERDRAQRCLEHLLAQTALDRMEIVVVDMAREPSPIPGLDHPNVRHFRISPLTTFGAGRAECVRRSRGQFIAFLEDHSYPDPDWAAEVILAFDHDVDVVSYAVAAANPESLLGRMFLMCEYGRWMQPAISGHLSISASHNVAYRRRALDPFWSRLDRLCQTEFIMHRQMQAAGARLWLAASAKVAHENWTQLGYGLRANGLLRRLFAAERVREGHWDILTRIVWAGGMALTPPLHIARVARSLVRRPALWPLFWASIPVMTMTYVTGSCFEAFGYLFGDAGCAEGFRDLEISIERQV